MKIEDLVPGVVEEPHSGFSDKPAAFVGGLGTGPTAGRQGDLEIDRAVIVEEPRFDLSHLSSPLKDVVAMKTGYGRWQRVA